MTGRYSRDYHGASAPSAPNSRHRACPPPRWLPGGSCDRGWFPRSPRNRSVREVPSSTPAASPRLRRSLSAWPPHRNRNPASELTRRPRGRTRHALHTGPYPPGLSQLTAYGASTTGSLSLHLLTSLDGPAPSGSPGTSRRCQGRLPPSPAIPGSGCPQLHQAAATAQRRRPFTSTRSRSTSWRTPVSVNSARCYLIQTEMILAEVIALSRLTPRQTRAVSRGGC